MDIAGRKIGRESAPFVIAEMSGNHNQSLERALAIVDAAAAAGADAIKLQTYTADTMTIDCSEGEFSISDPNSLWSGRTLHNLYREAHTPWEWHSAIFSRAAEKGILAFSTPFDETAVDFLETLNVPAYKIASFENTDLPLLRKVAKTGKPVIVSTGMASVAELGELVTTLRQNGCHDIVLLKCTSTYPASPENSNVRTLPHLRELFQCEVGLSDHTMGIGAAIAAVALGASVIEKHFTLSRADGGVDSVFSIEPAELSSLVIESRRAWLSLGGVSYGPTEAEAPSLQYRRSLYACKNIAKGELFTAENIRAIRPGFGLPPKFIDQIIGRQARDEIARGTPIRFEHF
ncbi:MULTISPECIES: pseudaminic acid synthase [Deefgea]|uniref:Pseudaminic acid synthase n=1 Tax=Deefgea chitinilytica TaxID=570276 RepID=A0ABS2CB71_9NEIS|nr:MULTISPECIES: pseudaminic acid synthase [Deefgea]MBM5570880.1 pseudaminic acid synthase [Deefgea chitinilytica]MBM9888109.1 pseudaminic acid synthase [Deefgea sp. CFH1-16]